MPNVLRVLSLGAGVQSTTLLLMAERGEFERPDCAIIADTPEPLKVKRHIEWLHGQTSIPIYHVERGNLREDCLRNARGEIKFDLPDLFGEECEGICGV